MGCFNVACSVSNISIGAGDPIVFIPLMPNNQYSEFRVGTRNRDDVIIVCGNMAEFKFWKIK